MTPYYEDSACVIYHGDCRDILPSLPVCDLVLTDPPYGINANRDRNSQQWGWVDYGDGTWDEQRPDDDLIRSLPAYGKHAIIWGGNYFTDLLPPSQGWLVWDKGQREFSLADGELAWSNFDNALRIYTIPRGRALRDGKVHPTQKSIALMQWSIGYADRNAGRKVETILDPFMGSGTTLRAAKDLQRRCIGIERNERHCESAAQRLSQETLGLEA